MYCKGSGNYVSVFMSLWKYGIYNESKDIEK